MNNRKPIGQPIRRFPTQLDNTTSSAEIEEVILTDGTVDESPKSEETAPIQVSEVRKPESEQLVWIKAAKDHVCWIGGKCIVLKKGKKIRVTKEQRKILAKSPLGLLDPVVD